MYQSSTDILWTKTLGACGISLLLTELKAFSNLSFQPSACWLETTLCPSRDISCVLQPACLTYSDPPTFPSQLHHPSYHVKSSDIKLPLRFCLNIPAPYKLVFDPHPQTSIFKNTLSFVSLWYLDPQWLSYILFCSYGVLHIPVFLSRSPAFLSRLEVLWEQGQILISLAPQQECLHRVPFMVRSWGSEARLPVLAFLLH